MHARIIVAVLLLAIAACVRPPPSDPTRVLQRPAPNTAVLKSNDMDPLRFCLVGTKDCAPLSEFGTCLLSTGRCKSDAQIQNASAKIRLRLESQFTGGANPEIIVPIER